MAEETTENIIKISKAHLAKAMEEALAKNDKAWEEKINKKIEELEKNNGKKLEEEIKKAVAERKTMEDTGLDLSGEVLPFKKGLESILTKSEKGHIDGRKPTDWEKEVMKSSDDLVWMAQAFCRGKGAPQPIENLYKTKAFERFLTIIKAGPNTGIRKALDSTAGKGLEWIPTILSTRLTEKIEVALRVAMQFVRFQMPASNTDIPRETGFPTAFNGAILVAPADSQTTTAKASFVAEKIIARTLLAYETEMDSVINLIPLIENRLAGAIARGVDNAIVNGQESGAIDLPAPAATDVRTLWDGLRKHAKTQSFTTDIANAKLTLTTFRKIVDALAFEFSENIEDLVVIAGKAEYNQLRGLAEVTTVDTFGPQFATIVNGEVKKIDNIDIIRSQHPPQTMDLLGVIPSPASDRAGLIVTSRQFWGWGVWQNVLLESDRDISKQEISIVGSMRGDFQGLQPVTLKGYNYGINIKTT